MSAAPAISRRLFVSGAAVAGLAGTTALAAERVVAPTPDERIAAALVELKAAYRERFPEVEIRTCINDEDDVVQFVQVIAFPERERVGKTIYLHNSKVVRREGGEA